jgi:type I restriction enzyme, R subunit
MSLQSEKVLEDQLIRQLQKQGYEFVSLTNESQLLSNLKNQLEKHNHTTFSPTEFERVINILNKGSVFEKAKTLREKQYIQRDNGDSFYFEFLNIEHWCQNEFQVTNQVTMDGKYKNRYDVTLSDQWPTSSTDRVKAQRSRAKRSISTRSTGITSTLLVVVPRCFSMYRFL